MIFGLLVIALVLIAAGLRGTEHELGQQMQSDLLGTGGFLTWFLAVLALGGIGYIPGLRTTSRYLMALLLVVIILRNQSFFANLQAALQNASSAGPAPSVPIPASLQGSGSGSGTSSGNSSASSGNSPLGQVASIASIASLFA